MPDLNVQATRHRAVDVPRLRDALLESWSGGYLLDLLTTHGSGGMHLPVHHRNERTRNNELWTTQEWTEWVIEQLAAAELFYVTEDMTELTMQAAAGAPSYQVYEDRMPARAGFVVYGKPFCHVPSELLAPQQRVELQAALWAPVPDTGGGVERAAPGVMLVTLQDSDVLLQTQPVAHLLGGRAASVAGMDSVMRQMRAAYGPLSYHEEYPLPYGNAPYGTEPGRIVKNFAVGAVMTTWLLMSQRITTVEQERLPRSARRQYIRDGRPEPTVRTVSLRRTNRGPDADPQQVQPGQESSRKYTKRWPVRGYGYWRNTWYPSKDRHEQQYVWVPEYMKGPEGAPLVGGERVSVLRK